MQRLGLKILMIYKGNHKGLPLREYGMIIYRRGAPIAIKLRILSSPPSTSIPNIFLLSF